MPNGRNCIILLYVRETNVTLGVTARFTCCEVFNYHYAVHVRKFSRNGHWTIDYSSAMKSYTHRIGTPHLDLEISSKQFTDILRDSVSCNGRQLRLQFKHSSTRHRFIQLNVMFSYENRLHGIRTSPPRIFPFSIKNHRFGCIARR